MDDLLKIAGNVMENFNPETDSANDFENLPDGRYNGVITEVKHRKNEKGTNWIAIKVEIESDEYEDKYKGRFLFVSHFFTEKTTDRSIKYIIKLVHDLGFEPLTLDAFKSFETLEESLQGIVGSKVTVDQKTSKSGFANYDVASAE